MPTNNQNIHPKLVSLFSIANGISKNFGKNCEVVIHDFQWPESSLVHIVGKVTNREVGAPITNLVLEKLQRKGNMAEDIIGYQSSTKDGRILKSSTLFIRDDQGNIIGCMCINYDLSDFFTCQQILEGFTKTNKPLEESHREEFFSDVNEALDEIIKVVLKEYPVPKQLLQKEDKLVIVKKLDEKGVFLVKGAIDQVANILGVSRYTIYNYLEEVRANPNSNIL